MRFTREAVVDYARTLIDTPFHDQAALPGVGCDCIGVMRCIAKHFGRPESEQFDKDIRFRGYSRFPNKRLLLEGCAAYFDQIPIADALPADVALARIQVEPQHFGLISSIEPKFRIIHSYIQAGGVTENIVDANWKAHVLRMYRFRGIE